VPCLWICCTGISYCLLDVVICVDCLFWDKILSVVWCCVCKLLVLGLGIVCWVVFCVDWLYRDELMFDGWCCVSGYVILRFGFEIWVVLFVWIVCTGVRYCVLGGIMCVRIGCTVVRFCVFCGVVWV